MVRLESLINDGKLKANKDLHSSMVRLERHDTRYVLGRKSSFTFQYG